MQKIFLSYHFDDKIAPVVNSIRKLIRTHDLEIEDGTRLGGQALIDKVKEKIASSDVAIILLTKRDVGKSSDWVKHERSTAHALGKRFLAFIEKGLQQSSPFTGFEYKEFDPNDLTKTLLDISEAIYGWKLELGERIEAHLEPQDIVNAVRENYDKKGVVQYRFLKKGDFGDWNDAKVAPKAGGVSLFLNGVTKDAELQIRITANKSVKESVVINRNLRFSVS
jgi:hypothetical protein